MAELQTQLGTIFITQLLVGNITEVAVPSILGKRTVEAQNKDSDVEMSEVEKAFYQVCLILFTCKEN